ncbi:MAG TPA: hypothetical protein VHQ22_18100 [Terriglobales bacterium]|jgi:hypothetical protein|nr:hypothetical protein [Terriglobales bacterium]
MTTQEQNQLKRILARIDELVERDKDINQPMQSIPVKTLAEWKGYADRQAEIRTLHDELKSMAA